ncbi:MAG: hypothetical protein QM704_14885 [Anaeromyxobacteraceae bacterium]
MPKPPVVYRLDMVERGFPTADEGLARLLPRTYFPEAAKLAGLFGFDPGFPIRERLDEAAGLYLSTHAARSPSPNEQRRRLDLVDRAARAVARGHAARGEALARLLEAGGMAGLPFLAPEIELRRASGLPFAFGRAEAEAVVAQVRAARRWLPTRRPPVSGDSDLRIFVVNIAKIYQEGTGKKPGRGREGPFPRFLSLVCAEIGIKISQEALVKLHRRWGK